MRLSAFARVQNQNAAKPHCGFYKSRRGAKKNIVELDKKYEEKYERILREELTHLCRGKSCKIFLFGSRAMDNIKKGSDFDIGIQGLDEREFEELSIKFYTFLDESIVPYEVDLINFDIVNSDFKNQALKHTKIWKTG